MSSSVQNSNAQDDQRTPSPPPQSPLTPAGNPNGEVVGFPIFDPNYRADFDGRVMTEVEYQLFLVESQGLAKTLEDMVKQVTEAKDSLERSKGVIAEMEEGERDHRARHVCRLKTKEKNRVEKNRRETARARRANQRQQQQAAPAQPAQQPRRRRQAPPAGLLRRSRRLMAQRRG
ncbi:MAG: hypothetical protein M1833_002823 [Piccolia ochrophora]|nr:MAG: hypothetical protein M1833_002823 [Piccolia ochrophora]